MNRVFIDWNLTESCAAECPSCTFGRNKVSALSNIPLEIQKTWEALNTVLGSTIHYSHDIVTPLDQVGDCDFTAFASSPVSELVLNLSRKDYENLRIKSILEQVGVTFESALVAVVPTNNPYQFDSNDDISHFISQMQQMFSFQIQNCLSDVTVAFVQNQIPSLQYQEQESAFCALVRSLRASGGPAYVRTHPYISLVRPFIDSAAKSNFSLAEDSYFNQSHLHRASSISHKYTQFSKYEGALQWHNDKNQSFGVRFSLMQKIPNLSHSEQLQQTRNVNRGSGISLMLTPDSVYLYHSPETIKNPHMRVPHTTFQSWLKSISDDARGFSGLGEVIDSYFKNLK